METVSIVIPAFNQGRYLPACVDRCLFQTWPRLEIIVVDGGSTDGTKEFLAGLEREIATRTVSPVEGMDEHGGIVRRTQLACPQDRSLRILSFDTDIGPTRTYNEGLGLASGTYCTYVVGDDLPHPHMIEDLVQALQASGADLAYSDLDIVDDDGRVVRQMRLPDYDFKTCFADWFRLGVSRLYRREWHGRVGLMDEAYAGANDYDHYLRMAMAGARFVHVPKILYSVRHHGERRQDGQHTPGRYANLLEESGRCALRAREFLRSGRAASG